MPEQESQPETIGLTRQQAADYLGVTTKTLDKYVRTGRVQSYRLGDRAIRFKRHDVDALLVAVGQLAADSPTQ